MKILSVRLLIVGILLYCVSYAVIPTITGFNPKSGKVGSLITITGNGFDGTTPANNIVYLGDGLASVSKASITSLEVIVPSGSSYSKITVINTSNRLQASSYQAFTPVFLSDGFFESNSFTNPRFFSLGLNYAYGIEALDLDGDTYLDAAMPSAGPNNGLIVSPNSSKISQDLTFDASINYPSADYSYCIAKGDLDGDGKQDIVTGNGDNTISIYTNNSSNSITGSTFSSAFTLLGVNNVKSISIADLNTDGKPDIICANYFGQIIIFQNNYVSGIPSFSSPIIIDGSYNRVIISDFNGDGRPDFAASSEGNNIIKFFRNNIAQGNGIDSSFLVSSYIYTMGFNYGMDCGDLDGDNRIDLVIADNDNSQIYIYNNATLNVSTINFNLGQTIPQLNHANFVSISDLDGDTKADIAVTGNSYTNIHSYVIKNLTVGNTITGNSFDIPVDLNGNYSSNVYGQKIADYDNDGKPDIGMVLDNFGPLIGFYKNTFDTNPVIQNVLPVNVHRGEIISILGIFLDSVKQVSMNAIYLNFDIKNSNLILATITGNVQNGNLEISSSKVVRNYIVNLDLAPIITAFSPTSAKPGSIVSITGLNFEEFDNKDKNQVFFGPTRAEVLSSTNTSMFVKVPQNSGCSQIEYTNQITHLSTNSNGYFTPTYNGNSNPITGTSFASITTITTLQIPYYINLLAVYNPQKPDFISTYFQNSVYFNAGLFVNNTLVNTITSAAIGETNNPTDISGLYSPNPEKPKMADMNGDGQIDQLVLQGGKIYYSTFHNGNGYNSFSNIIGNTVAAYAIGDVTGDGKPDIVTYDYAAPASIIIYQNMDGYTFSSITTVTGSGFWDIKLMDMDNDGKKDIIALASSNIVVYKNTCGGTISGVCFPPTYNIAIPQTTNGKLEIADLNNDLYPEIIIRYIGYFSSAPGINMYMNLSTLGSLSFDNTGINLSGFIQNGSANVPTKDFAIGDLNGDNKPDLVIINDKYSDGLITIFQNNSTTAGVLTIATPPTTLTVTGKSLTSLSVNDLDGDWRPDIEVTIANSVPGIIIFKNQSPGQIYVPVDSITVKANTGTAVITAPGASLQLDIHVYPEPLASDKSWYPTVNDLTNNSMSSIDYYVDSLGRFSAPSNGVFEIDINSKAYAGEYIYGSIFVTVTGQNISITDYTPKSAVPGSILNITGNYFNTVPDSNLVLIGGVKAEVISSDLYNLQVKVPNGAKFDLISVSNADIGQSALSSVSFLPTFQGGFPIDTNYIHNVNTLNCGPNYAISSADLDGDGFTDLVVMNDDSLTIFRNISGTNVGQINFSAFSIQDGNNLTALHIRDVNNDGKPDILVGESSEGNGIGIYYNSSNPGSLSETDFYGGAFSININSPCISLRTLDLDSDGYLDIVYIDNSGYLYSYSSNPFNNNNLRQQYNGFYEFNNSPLVLNNPGSSIDISDLDNDGIDEVIVSSSLDSGLYVFSKEFILGSQGQGKKAQPYTSYINLKYTSDLVRIVDINSDSYPDILSLNSASQTLIILKNNTGGQDSLDFQEAAIIKFNGLPLNLDVGDINGDNLPDLAVTDTSKVVYLFQNRSTPGNLDSNSFIRNSLTTSAYPSIPLIADFNNDSIPDIAISHDLLGNISIYRNSSPGIGVRQIIVIPEDSASVLSLNRKQLQMKAIILPFGADTSVTWSLIHNNSSANNNDLTTISGTGLLNLNSTTINGIVTVVGTSVSNPNVSGYFAVTIIGKSVTPSILIASNENLTIAGFVASPCYATYELSVPSVTGQSYQWYYNDLDSSYGKKGLKLVDANNNIYKPVVNGYYYVIALDTIAYVYHNYPVTISGFNSASIAGINNNTKLIIVKDSIADSYQWYVDNIPIKNATSNSLNVYYNGTYYLITKNNADGCKLKSNEVQIGNENLRSIQESGLIKDSTVENYGLNIQPFDVKVYPNPASSVFTIEVKSQEDINTYEITDITGRVMETGEMLKSGDKFSITANNRHLDKGIYFVTIKNHSQKKCIKVVLE